MISNRCFLQKQKGMASGCIAVPNVVVNLLVPVLFKDT